MKREEFLRYLRQHSCCLKREGRSHSVYVNPANGKRCLDTSKLTTNL